MCRFLPTASCVLPGLDLPRRPLLHGFHYASVHHLRGPLPLPSLPDEVRAEQDTKTSHPQDHLRLAALHRHEPPTQPHVLTGNPLPSLHHNPTLFFFQL